MAKKSLWQSIKDFFTGGGSSSGGSSSGSGKRSSGSYYGGGYSSSYRSYGRSSREDEKEKQRQKIKEQNKQTTAKLAAIAKVSQRTDALSSGKKSLPPEPKALANNGVERAVKKIGEKSQHQKNLETLKANRLEKQGAYHEATHHRYDVAEKGISKEERERRKQNIRTAPMGEMMFGRDDEAVDVAKAKMKYDKARTSAERGAANAFTLGTVNFAEKRLAKGNRKEAEDIYQKNKSKGAETLGSLAGGLAIWGGTAKGFEDIGSKAVGKAATTELGKKLGAEKLAQVMAGEGAKAALARSLVGDTIQDSTMGAVDTAMDIATRDDLETPGDYLKAFAKGQAANYAMGLAGNVAGQALPVAGKAVRNAWGNFADESRKLRIVPKGVDEVGAKGAKSAAENLKVETAPPKLEEANAPFVARTEDYVNDLNSWRGETYLGSYGHITKNADGTYNLFRNGIGDTTLTEKEALDYIDAAVKQINADEEAIRVTRTSPLTDAENARITEIDNEINRLEAEGKEAADNLKNNKYKDIEKYWDEQGERGQKITDLTREKEQINIKEPNADDVVGRIKQVDEELGNRVEALQREYVEVNARAEQGDPAAIARREEIQAEVQSIIDDFRAKPERVAPPELKAEPERIEPPRAEESGVPFENERGDEAWERVRAADAEKARRQEMTEAAQKEWEENRQTIETPRSGAESQNVVNKEIQQAAEDAGYESEWTSGKDYEGYSIREADEIWGTEKVDGEVRTKRGGYTLATGMGDVKFAGDMKDAIASGDFDRNVRHNKEEYTKAVNRLVNYLDGKGGKDGKEGIIDLINRFENFAKSNKPLTSNEMRDQLYDILAAVDLANGNKDKEWASKLFMAATRAGAEQSSVGGLTLYQWHRIAMSSPEHRAKVVKEQIENMFNSSRKFRKKYLGSVKKKLGDKFSAVGDDLPLDKFMEENPEVSKGMKAAYERLEKATSKEEVETAASEFLLEARKVMPVTAFDQLTQWRYVAMLSSPKTHIKNVVGNLYSGTLGQMSVAMSSSMENRLAKELNLTTTKNVDLSKGIAADQDLYLKSASGISNKARTNAKKGVFAGIELRNAKSKLKDAERKLATAEKGADTTELKKQVKELTEKVAEAQKNFDAKKIDPNKDLLGAKAQDLYHTKSVEQLIQDATKWEKQTYGAVSGGLEKASNFIGGALETSDAVAVERIYRETAEKILKANDYERFVKLAAGEGKEAAAAKAICDRIEEYAAEHAAYRAALDTYRNYNAVATWMNKVVKNTLYNADAKWYKKAGGFALHAVMPFTKVPTNIMKRSFDYSPAGLIQGKKMLNEAIASGNYAEINKAVERLAEGRIGTGIAALGMAMGMLDPDGMTVTTRLNRNDERDKAKKDRGYMDYSVKLGNRDYTLEWATPTASDFFVGVETGRMLNNIYQKFADGNGLDFDPSKALEASGEILTRLVEPTLQLGMFQGVNSILEDSMEQRYEESNINPLFKAVGAITKNYVSSMTPSIVRSLSKAFAKSDYYISGKNDLDYRKNLLISKIPGLSAQMLDAKTNAWGEIKNERSDPKERVLRGAETLLAPWNSSEITWDDTDTKLYDFAEEYKKTHPKAQTLDFLPKVFYDYNNEGLTFGKNDATSKHVELSNNDAAQYNIARGKAGEDAMAAAMESVIFNRWYKDEKGKYTISDSKNYTPEMKAKKIAEFKGKGTKEVVAWVMDQPQFKNATSAEQAQIIREVIGNSGKDTSIGAKRTSELAVAKRHDISEEEYNYKNEVSANAQKALDDAIAAGIVTYEMATDFARNAGKTYYRTDQKGEEGGSVQTYYNKKEMMEYLAEKGYDYEEAEALYNAFKSANAKEFSGISTSSGSGRRGYGGYRHGSGGGGSSAKAKVPAPKKIAKGSLKSGEALVSKKKSSSSRSNSKTTLARVEAKIDLPTAKYSKQKRG